METSFFQSLKSVMVNATGLSKDALHVYVGLALLILAAIALRKRVSSIGPWVVVVVAACSGELLDMRDDLATIATWNWSASLRDILNTIFWPSVILVLVRTTDLFRADGKSTV